MVDIKQKPIFRIMVFGLLTNIRFWGGFVAGVVVNQELGSDKVRFYVENPQILMDEIVGEVKKYSKD